MCGVAMPKLLPWRSSIPETPSVFSGLPFISISRLAAMAKGSTGIVTMPSSLRKASAVWRAILRLRCAYGFLSFFASAAPAFQGNPWRSPGHRQTACRYPYEGVTRLGKIRLFGPAQQVVSRHFEGVCDSPERVERRFREPASKWAIELAGMPALVARSLWFNRLISRAFFSLS